MTLERVWIPSPNYSNRGGAQVTTIVLHTAEGARTIRELGNFFANPGSGVSSHAGIDDTPNTIGEYVDRDRKAWTASNANPWSVQAELCAFAAWSPQDWAAHPVMLQNTAAWIAEEAAAFGIPIRKLSASDAQNPNIRGVCQHNDLGAMGGGHWDCGPGFPIDEVLDMALTGGGPQPDQPHEDEDMPYFLFAPEGGGRWWITNLRTDSRPVDSLQDAIDTDYFLRSLAGQAQGLVCNRDRDGNVAGPIGVGDDYLAAVVAESAAGER